jgi:hypothetical protein
MSNSDRLKFKNQSSLEKSITKNKGQLSLILAKKRSDRWDIFHRLQSLDVQCKCSTNEPLLGELHSPTTVAQIWSVLRQFSASRTELIDWLDSCWQQESDRQKKATTKG